MDGAAVALTRLREEGVIRGWGLGVNRVAPCLAALDRSDPDVMLLAGRYTLLDNEDALVDAVARGREKAVGGADPGAGLGGESVGFGEALRVTRGEDEKDVGAVGPDLLTHGVEDDTFFRRGAVVDGAAGDDDRPACGSGSDGSGERGFLRHGRVVFEVAAGEDG